MSLYPRAMWRQAFAAADVVIEMDTSHHNPTQGSLDPWCCVADWKEGRLTVFSNSYAADQTRMHVSQMLELPIAKVRVISKYVAGSSGEAIRRSAFLPLHCAGSQEAGRPVKFKHTRRDSFHDTRQGALYHCKVGATAAGKITALHFKSIGDIGAHADHSVFALKFAPAEISEAAAGPDPEHQDGILCRLHGPHPRLHDARGGQLPVQLHLRPDDRWPG